MIDFAEAAGADLAVEVENAEKAVRFSRARCAFAGECNRCCEWSWP